MRIARGLRIEFKNFRFQAGVFAMELWHLVPMYIQIKREVSIQLYVVT